MKGVTECIILGRRKYGDSSFVVQSYTREKGRMDFVIRGVSPKSKKKRKSHLEPLTVVELTYVSGKGELVNGNELRTVQVPATIHEDIRKTAIAMFTAEVLESCLTTSEKDEIVFDFICDCIRELDDEPHAVNWHLWFLWKLTRFLGCEPDLTNMEDARYFDLVEGLFTTEVPPYPYYISEELIGDFKFILTRNYDQASGLILSNAGRKELLDSVIRYYELHLEALKNIRSLEVLETVFS